MNIPTNSYNKCKCYNNLNHDCFGNYILTDDCKIKRGIAPCCSILHNGDKNLTGNCRFYKPYKKYRKDKEEFAI